MNTKAVLGVSITLLLVSVLTIAPNLRMSQASSETTVYVDPPNITDPTLTPGSNFTVEVMVSDVEAEYGCYSWEVKMSFNPGVLESVGVAEGDFLKDQPGGTWFDKKIEEGWLRFYCITLGMYPGVNGNGTLGVVEFRVRAIGDSVIKINSSVTKLCEAVPPYYPPEDAIREIPCARENGYFNNSGSAVISAIVDMRPEILNLKSNDKEVTAYIELSGGYDSSNIDFSTIMLNNTIPTELDSVEIGDYDNDTLPDLAARFNRTAVKEYLLENCEVTGLSQVILTVTGKLQDGTPFKGSCVIKVIKSSARSSNLFELPY